MPLSTNAKVMLVEDDLAMQSILRTLLELEGMRVAPAPMKNTLAEMLDAIRDEQPDVLLLDVHLRSLSGIDLLRLLRGDPSTARSRVVMTSGMDKRDECLAAGADDFLMKPYMPDELIRKLRGA